MVHSSQAWNVLCLIWLLIIVIMINTFQYGLFSLCLDNVAKLPFFPQCYYHNEIIITNIMMAETNCDGSVSVQIWIVTRSL